MTANSVPTAPIAEPRSSFSDRPVIIQSTPDFQFLSATGEMTLVELKSNTQATTPVRRKPLRVPRPLTFQEWTRLGFILLQKWDGVVLQVDAETFTAKLIDSEGKLPDHDATFLRAELPKEEQELIEPGSPFVWTLGYRKIGNTRERASVLYFRRLPPWEEGEIVAAGPRAKELRERIEWK